MAEHELEEDPFFVLDSAKFPKNNIIVTNSLKIRQKWINHYEKFSKVVGDIRTEKPEVIIITSLILHPLTMTGWERKSNITAEEIIDAAERADITAKNALSIIMNVAKSIGAKVLILEAEPVKPEVEKFDSLRNELIDKHNVVLEKLIPDEGIDGTLFRLSMNLKSVNIDGAFMLPDRIHLIKKDIPRKTPPAMLANLNTIFNFLCNKYDSNANLCCQKSLDLMK